MNSLFSTNRGKLRLLRQEQVDNSRFGFKIVRSMAILLFLVAAMALGYTPNANAAVWTVTDSATVSINGQAPGATGAWGWMDGPLTGIQNGDTIRVVANAGSAFSNTLAGTNVPPGGTAGEGIFAILGRRGITNIPLLEFVLGVGFSSATVTALDFAAMGFPSSITRVGILRVTGVANGIGTSITLPAAATGAAPFTFRNFPITTLIDSLDIAPLDGAPPTTCMQWNLGSGQLIRSINLSNAGAVNLFTDTAVGHQFGATNLRVSGNIVITGAGTSAIAFRNVSIEAMGNTIQAISGPSELRSLIINNVGGATVTVTPGTPVGTGTPPFIISGELNLIRGVVTGLVPNTDFGSITVRTDPNINGLPVTIPTMPTIATITVRGNITGVPAYDGTITMQNGNTAYLSMDTVTALITSGAGELRFTAATAGIGTLTMNNGTIITEATLANPRMKVGTANLTAGGAIIGCLQVLGTGGLTSGGRSFPNLDLIYSGTALDVTELRTLQTEAGVTAAALTRVRDLVINSGTFVNTPKLEVTGNLTITTGSGVANFSAAGANITGSILQRPTVNDALKEVADSNWSSSTGGILIGRIIPITADRQWSDLVLTAATNPTDVDVVQFTANNNSVLTVDAAGARAWAINCAAATVEGSTLDISKGFNVSYKKPKPNPDGCVTIIGTPSVVASINITNYVPATNAAGTNGTLTVEFDTRDVVANGKRFVAIIIPDTLVSDLGANPPVIRDARDSLIASLREFPYAMTFNNLLVTGNSTQQANALASMINLYNMNLPNEYTRINTNNIQMILVPAISATAPIVPATTKPTATFSGLKDNTNYQIAILELQQSGGAWAWENFNMISSGYENIDTVGTPRTARSHGFAIGADGHVYVPGISFGTAATTNGLFVVEMKQGAITGTPPDTTRTDSLDASVAFNGHTGAMNLMLPADYTISIEANPYFIDVTTNGDTIIHNKDVMAEKFFVWKRSIPGPVSGWTDGVEFDRIPVAGGATVSPWGVIATYMDSLHKREFQNAAGDTSYTLGAIPPGYEFQIAVTGVSQENLINDKSLSIPRYEATVSRAVRSRGSNFTIKTSTQTAQPSTSQWRVFNPKTQVIDTSVRWIEITVDYRETIPSTHNYKTLFISGDSLGDATQDPQGGAFFTNATTVAARKMNDTNLPATGMRPNTMRKSFQIGGYQFDLMTGPIALGGSNNTKYVWTFRRITTVHPVGREDSGDLVLKVGRSRTSGTTNLTNKDVGIIYEYPSVNDNHKIKFDTRIPRSHGITGIEVNLFTDTVHKFYVSAVNLNANGAAATTAMAVPPATAGSPFRNSNYIPLGTDSFGLAVPALYDISVYGRIRDTAKVDGDPAPVGPGAPYSWTKTINISDVNQYSYVFADTNNGFVTHREDDTLTPRAQDSVLGFVVELEQEMLRPGYEYTITVTARNIPGVSGFSFADMTQRFSFGVPRVIGHGLLVNVLGGSPASTAGAGKLQGGDDGGNMEIYVPVIYHNMANVPSIKPPDASTGKVIATGDPLDNYVAMPIPELFGADQPDNYVKDARYSMIIRGTGYSEEMGVLGNEWVSQITVGENDYFRSVVEELGVQLIPASACSTCTAVYGFQFNFNDFGIELPLGFEFDIQFTAVSDRFGYNKTITSEKFRTGIKPQLHRHGFYVAKGLLTDPSMDLYIIPMNISGDAVRTDDPGALLPHPSNTTEAEQGTFNVTITAVDDFKEITLVERNFEMLMTDTTVTKTTGNNYGLNGLSTGSPFNIKAQNYRSGDGGGNVIPKIPGMIYNILVVANIGTPSDPDFVYASQAASISFTIPGISYQYKLSNFENGDEDHFWEAYNSTTGIGAGVKRIKVIGTTKNPITESLLDTFALEPRDTISGISFVKDDNNPTATFANGEYTQILRVEYNPLAVGTSIADVSNAAGVGSVSDVTNKLFLNTKGPGIQAIHFTKNEELFPTQISPLPKVETPLVIGLSDTAIGVRIMFEDNVTWNPNLSNLPSTAGLGLPTRILADDANDVDVIEFVRSLVTFKPTRITNGTDVVDLDPTNPSDAAEYNKMQKALDYLFSGWVRMTTRYNGANQRSIEIRWSLLDSDDEGASLITTAAPLFARLVVNENAFVGEETKNPVVFDPQQNVPKIPNDTVGLGSGIIGLKRSIMSLQAAHRSTIGEPANIYNATSTAHYIGTLTDTLGLVQNGNSDVASFNWTLAARLRGNQDTAFAVLLKIISVEPLDVGPDALGDMMVYLYYWDVDTNNDPIKMYIDPISLGGTGAIGHPMGDYGEFVPAFSMGSNNLIITADGPKPKSNPNLDDTTYLLLRFEVNKKAVEAIYKPLHLEISRLIPTRGIKTPSTLNTEGATNIGGTHPYQPFGIDFITPKYSFANASTTSPLQIANRVTGASHSGNTGFYNDSTALDSALALRIDRRFIELSPVPANAGADTTRVIHVNILSQDSMLELQGNYEATGNTRVVAGAGLAGQSYPSLLMSGSRLSANGNALAVNLRPAAQDASARTAIVAAITENLLTNKDTSIILKLPLRNKFTGRIDTFNIPLVFDVLRPVMTYLGIDTAKLLARYSGGNPLDSSYNSYYGDTLATTFGDSLYQLITPLEGSTLEYFFDSVATPVTHLEYRLRFNTPIDTSTPNKEIWKNLFVNGLVLAGGATNNNTLGTPTNDGAAMTTTVSPATVGTLDVIKYDNYNPGDPSATPEPIPPSNYFAGRRYNLPVGSFTINPVGDMVLGGYTDFTLRITLSTEIRNDIQTVFENTTDGMTGYLYPLTISHYTGFNANNTPRSVSGYTMLLATESSTNDDLVNQLVPNINMKGNVARNAWRMGKIKIEPPPELFYAVNWDIVAFDTIGGHITPGNAAVTSASNIILELDSAGALAKARAVGAFPALRIYAGFQEPLDSNAVVINSDAGNENVLKLDLAPILVFTTPSGQLIDTINAARNALMKYGTWKFAPSRTIDGVAGCGLIYFEFTNEEAFRGLVEGGVGLPDIDEFKIELVNNSGKYATSKTVIVDVNGTPTPTIVRDTFAIPGRKFDPIYSYRLTKGIVPIATYISFEGPVTGQALLAHKEDSNTVDWYSRLDSAEPWGGTTRHLFRAYRKNGGTYYNNSGVFDIAGNTRIGFKFVDEITGVGNSGRIVLNGKFGTQNVTIVGTATVGGNALPGRDSTIVWMTIDSIKPSAASNQYITNTFETNQPLRDLVPTMFEVTVYGSTVRVDTTMTGQGIATLPQPGSNLLIDRWRATPRVLTSSAAPNVTPTGVDTILVISTSSTPNAGLADSITFRIGITDANFDTTSRNGILIKIYEQSVPNATIEADTAYTDTLQRDAMFRTKAINLPANSITTTSEGGDTASFLIKLNTPGLFDSSAFASRTMINYTNKKVVIFATDKFGHSGYRIVENAFGFIGPVPPMGLDSVWFVGKPANSTAADSIDASGGEYFRVRVDTNLHAGNADGGRDVSKLVSFVVNGVRPSEIQTSEELRKYREIVNDTIPIIWRDGVITPPATFPLEPGFYFIQDTLGVATATANLASARTDSTAAADAIAAAQAALATAQADLATAQAALAVAQPLWEQAMADLSGLTTTATNAGTAYLAAVTDSIQADAAYQTAVTTAGGDLTDPAVVAAQSALNSAITLAIQTKASKDVADLAVTTAQNTITVQGGIVTSATNDITTAEGVISAQTTIIETNTPLLATAMVTINAANPRTFVLSYYFSSSAPIVPAAGNNVAQERAGFQPVTVGSLFNKMMSNRDPAESYVTGQGGMMYKPDSMKTALQYSRISLTVAPNDSQNEDLGPEKTTVHFIDGSLKDPTNKLVGITAVRRVDVQEALNRAGNSAVIMPSNLPLPANSTATVYAKPDTLIGIPPSPFNDFGTNSMLIAFEVVFSRNCPATTAAFPASAVTVKYVDALPAQAMYPPSPSANVGIDNIIVLPQTTPANTISVGSWFVFVKLDSGYIGRVAIDEFRNYMKPSNIQGSYTNTLEIKVLDSVLVTENGQTFVLFNFNQHLTTVVGNSITVRATGRKTESERVINGNTIDTQTTEVGPELVLSPPNGYVFPVVPASGTQTVRVPIDFVLDSNFKYTFSINTALQGLGTLRNVVSGGTYKFDTNRITLPPVPFVPVHLDSIIMTDLYNDYQDYKNNGGKVDGINRIKPVAGDRIIQLGFNISYDNLWSTFTGDSVYIDPIPNEIKIVSWNEEEEVENEIPGGTYIISRPFAEEKTVLVEFNIDEVYLQDPNYLQYFDKPTKVYVKSVELDGEEMSFNTPTTLNPRIGTIDTFYIMMKSLFEVEPSRGGYAKSITPDTLHPLAQESDITTNGITFTWTGDYTGAAADGKKIELFPEISDIYVIVYENGAQLDSVNRTAMTTTFAQNTTETSVTINFGANHRVPFTPGNTYTFEFGRNQLADEYGNGNEAGSIFATYTRATSRVTEVRAVDTVFSNNNTERPYTKSNKLAFTVRYAGGQSAVPNGQNFKIGIDKGTGTIDTLHGINGGLTPTGNQVAITTSAVAGSSMEEFLLTFDYTDATNKDTAYILRIIDVLGTSDPVPQSNFSFFSVKQAHNITMDFVVPEVNPVTSKREFPWATDTSIVLKFNQPITLPTARATTDFFVTRVDTRDSLDPDDDPSTDNNVVNPDFNADTANFVIRTTPAYTWNGTDSTVRIYSLGWGDTADNYRVTTKKVDNNKEVVRDLWGNSADSISTLKITATTAGSPPVTTYDTAYTFFSVIDPNIIIPPPPTVTSKVREMRRGMNSTGVGGPEYVNTDTVVFRIIVDADTNARENLIPALNVEDITVTYIDVYGNREGINGISNDGASPWGTTASSIKIREVLQEEWTTDNGDGGVEYGGERDTIVITAVIPYPTTEVQQALNKTGIKTWVSEILYWDRTKSSTINDTLLTTEQDTFRIKTSFTKEIVKIFPDGTEEIENTYFRGAGSQAGVWIDFEDWDDQIDSAYTVSYFNNTIIRLTPSNNAEGANNPIIPLVTTWTMLDSTGGVPPVDSAYGWRMRQVDAQLFLKSGESYTINLTSSTFRDKWGNYWGDGDNVNIGYGFNVLQGIGVDSIRFWSGVDYADSSHNSTKNYLVDSTDDVPTTVYLRRNVAPVDILEIYINSVSPATFAAAGVDETYFRVVESWQSTTGTNWRHIDSIYTGTAITGDAVDYNGGAGTFGWKAGVVQTITGTPPDPDTYVRVDTIVIMGRPKPLTGAETSSKIRITGLTSEADNLLEWKIADTNRDNVVFSVRTFPLLSREVIQPFIIPVMTAVQNTSGNTATRTGSINYVVRDREEGALLDTIGDWTAVATAGIFIDTNVNHASGRRAITIVDTNIKITTDGVKFVADYSDLGDLTGTDRYILTLVDGSIMDKWGNVYPPTSTAINDTFETKPNIGSVKLVTTAQGTTEVGNDNYSNANVAYFRINLGGVTGPLTPTPVASDFTVNYGTVTNVQQFGSAPTNYYVVTVNLDGIGEDTMRVIKLTNFSHRSAGINTSFGPNYDTLHLRKFFTTDTISPDNPSVRATRIRARIDGIAEFDHVSPTIHLIKIELPESNVVGTGTGGNVALTVNPTAGFVGSIETGTPYDAVRLSLSGALTNQTPYSVSVDIGALRDRYGNTNTMPIAFTFTTEPAIQVMNVTRAAAPTPYVTNDNPVTLLSPQTLRTNTLELYFTITVKNSSIDLFADYGSIAPVTDSNIARVFRVTAGGTPGLANSGTLINDVKFVRYGAETATDPVDTIIIVAALSPTNNRERGLVSVVDCYIGSFTDVIPTATSNFDVRTEFQGEIDVQPGLTATILNPVQTGGPGILLVSSSVAIEWRFIPSTIAPKFIGPYAAAPNGSTLTGPPGQSVPVSVEILSGGSQTDITMAATTQQGQLVSGSPRINTTFWGVSTPSQYEIALMPGVVEDMYGNPNPELFDYCQYNQPSVYSIDLVNGAGYELAAAPLADNDLLNVPYGGDRTIIIRPLGNNNIRELTVTTVGSQTLPNLNRTIRLEELTPIYDETYPLANVLSHYTYKFTNLVNSIRVSATVDSYVERTLSIEIYPNQTDATLTFREGTIGTLSVGNVPQTITISEGSTVVVDIVPRPGYSINPLDRPSYALVGDEYSIRRMNSIGGANRFSIPGSDINNDVIATINLRPNQYVLAATNVTDTIPHPETNEYANVAYNYVDGVSNPGSVITFGQSITLRITGINEGWSIALVRWTILGTGGTSGVAVYDPVSQLYTIGGENITGNMQITIVPEPALSRTFAFTLTESGQGSISNKQNIWDVSSGLGEEVREGSTISFVATPAAGWQISTAIYRVGNGATQSLEVIGQVGTSTTYSIPGANVTGPVIVNIVYTLIPVGNHTISFSSNATGTTGTMPDFVFPVGRDTTLPANQFVRPGFAFTRWTTTAQGGGTAYENAGTIRMDAVGTTTLFAEWTAVAAGDLIVTAEFEGVITPFERTAANQRFTNQATNLQFRIRKTGGTTPMGTLQPADFVITNGTGASLSAVSVVGGDTVRTLTLNATGTVTTGVEVRLDRNPSGRIATWNPGIISYNVKTSSGHTISSFTPANNSQDIPVSGTLIINYTNSGSGFPWDTIHSGNLTATLSPEPQGQPSPFVFSKGAGNNILSAHYNQGLQPDVTYTVTLNGDFKDAWGNNIPKPTSWSFRTSNVVLPTYTVRFNSNGGQGTMPDFIATLGQDEILPANTYTRTNAIFRGWKVGTNTAAPTLTALNDVLWRQNADYENQGEFRNLTLADSIVTLYALWEGAPYRVKIQEQGFDINISQYTSGTSLQHVTAFGENGTYMLGGTRNGLLLGTAIIRHGTPNVIQFTTTAQPGVTGNPIVTATVGGATIPVTTLAGINSVSAANITGDVVIRVSDGKSYHAVVYNPNYTGSQVFVVNHEVGVAGTVAQAPDRGTGFTFNGWVEVNGPTRDAGDTITFASEGETILRGTWTVAPPAAGTITVTQVGLAETPVRTLAGTGTITIGGQVYNTQVRTNVDTLVYFLGGTGLQNLTTADLTTSTNATIAPAGTTLTISNVEAITSTLARVVVRVNGPVTNAAGVQISLNRAGSSTNLPVWGAATTGTYYSVRTSTSYSNVTASPGPNGTGAAAGSILLTFNQPTANTQDAIASGQISVVVGGYSDIITLPTGTGNNLVGWANYSVTPSITHPVHFTGEVRDRWGNVIPLPQDYTFTTTDAVETYTVSYALNPGAPAAATGTSPVTRTANVGANYTIETPAAVGFTPNANYSFVRWGVGVANNSGRDDQYLNPNDVVRDLQRAGQPITLSAIWLGNPYTLTFTNVPAGVTISGIENYNPTAQTATIRYGTLTSLTINMGTATVDSLWATGTNTDGTAFAIRLTPAAGTSYLIPATRVGGDMTIDFRTPAPVVPQYNIQYMANGGDGGNQTRTTNVGTFHTVQSNIDLGITRTGFTLTGWRVGGTSTDLPIVQPNTQLDGSNTFAAGSTTQLWAVWQGTPYKVTFTGPNNTTPNATITPDGSGIQNFGTSGNAALQGDIQFGVPFNFNIVPNTDFNRDSVVVSFRTLSGTDTSFVKAPPLPVQAPNAFGVTNVEALRIAGNVTITVYTTTTLQPTTPTVTSIVRATPTAEFTNAASVVFTVTVTPAPATALTAAAFTLTSGSGATISSVSNVGGTYTVTVSTTGVANIKAGQPVGITAVTGVTFSPTTNQAYNVRRQFMAVPAYTPALSGATNVSINGSLSIAFDERLVNGSITATLAPVIPAGPIALIKTSASDSIVRGSYSNLNQFTTYTVTLSNNTITDAWGNAWTAPPTSWSFETNGPANARIQTIAFTDIDRESFVISWTTEGGANAVVIWVTEELPTSPTIPSYTDLTGGGMPTGYDRAFLIPNNGGNEMGSIKWNTLPNNTRFFAVVWAHDGNTHSSNYLIDSVRTTRRKDAFVDSRFATFAVSEITPHPVEDEAEFSVLVDKAGALNVSIHDLSGSKVMQLVDNRYVYEGTEVFIKLDGLYNIASGAYNLIISIGDDRVEKTIIIRK